MRRRELEERPLLGAQLRCGDRLDRRQLHDLAGDDDRRLAGGRGLCEGRRPDLVAERPVAEDGVGSEQEERRVGESRGRIGVFDEVDAQALGTELVGERATLADRLRDGADRPRGRGVEQRLANGCGCRVGEDDAACKPLVKLDRDRGAGAAAAVEQPLALLVDQAAELIEVR